MQIECPLNSNKQYIIPLMRVLFRHCRNKTALTLAAEFKTCLKFSQQPTTSWLNPVHKLMTEDISSKGLIMLSKYMNTHDVIVKITKNSDYKKVKSINNAIRGLTNFPAVFCVISCLESDINLESEYKNISGYCERSNDSNTEIILEIMKQYKHSLLTYKEKFNLINIKPLLHQILLAQLNAFEKIGFLHNDIHLGNILLDFKQEKEIELKYNFDKTNYMIKTQRVIILMDFDKSIIMDPLNGIEHDKYDYDINIDKMTYPPLNLNNRIYANIIKTLYSFLRLINLNEQNKMRQIIETIEKDKIEDYGGTEHSLMNSLYNKSRSYPEYVNESIHNMIQMLNVFWHELYDEYLFPKYTLQKS